MRDTGVHNKRRVLNGHRLDEIRIVPENIVRITDIEQGRNELEFQFFGEFLYALDILEIGGSHVAEIAKLRHFRIGEKNVGVSGGGRAPPQFREFVDVLVDLEIARAIKPFFQPAGRRNTDQANKGAAEKETGHIHRLINGKSSGSLVTAAKNEG